MSTIEPVTSVEEAEAPSEPTDLTRADLYLNRHISLLAFNERVLAQARDPGVPLLERLKFLCITSSNLDEFFETRVAGLKELQAYGAWQVDVDNRSPAETLRLITARAHELVVEQYRVLNEELLPALAHEQIHLIAPKRWTKAQRAWVRRHFEEEVSPLLSPIGLDPAHPFPRILNKSLNFILSLEGKDAFGRNSALAVLQAPRILPRVIAMPQEVAPKGHCFVLLSEIIRTHAEDLFPGMQVKGFYPFRLTRNSEMFVDEEEVDDLLRAMEGELSSRRYGDEVRLEVARECPTEMVELLLKQFELEHSDVYSVDGPVNLSRLMAMIDQVERPELKYPPFTPGLPRELVGASGSAMGNLFEVIRKGDVLLHQPFQSFMPVVEFLRQASQDPQVLAIRMTLYRTGADSAIVDLLRQAAIRGKEVTVVVELRARFDEEANISLATRLQEAGAHVVYGVVGYKTHAKLTWVVRREGRQLRHYMHLGTGNYHARTARQYTDFGLLTCNPKIAEDVNHVFLQLTSLGRVPRLQRLLQSPFSLVSGLLERIHREIDHHRAGRPAAIRFKVNGVTDREVIQALYEASQAGVPIDLIVRGMCCLRPGVPGVSETIRVRSIVGRFLEHPRVYYFENGGKPEVYCASADLMERNLHRRIEVAFPVLDPALRQRVIEEALDYYLRDNMQSWLLQDDGTYIRADVGDEAPFSAQGALLKALASEGTIGIG
ncbi:polyphosphate kinase 1 [Candidatus Macondimonas diazotrophica]|jgi:polyphosphate kinase|uniref:Polyphosphate kinase n=1 Tax=Candidatus Macondimonas diazotrophica TaxID=2305248 RepID=A0A4Z0FBN2_9GAMM|nr:polyphosphate kinase 1 [Candidatus Macondimonas diazotrophica]NCU01292.1 polyphosphate kinase 1 [Candidatus Macondimonas diazotrophica]TFZ83313.1 polyphosphate kinase 1 [Candidatus Macondimonas diazotrophica]HBG30309.1 polyphosphate kinase 1 [Gammaproteobacteria bacterium]HCO42546.1 polyphosphate kinase 1 [Gammaproteobacteria bacterium]